MASKKVMLGFIACLLIGFAAGAFSHNAPNDVPVLSDRLNDALEQAKKYRFDENNLLDSIEQTLNADNMYIADWKNRREIPEYWGYALQLSSPFDRAIADARKGDYRLIRIDGIYAGVDCMGEVPNINVFTKKTEMHGDMGLAFDRGVLGHNFIDQLIYFATGYNMKMTQQPGYPYRHVCWWVPRKLTADQRFLLRLTTPTGEWNVVNGQYLPPDKAGVTLKTETQSLHSATYFGHLKAMKEFLAEGADPNGWDEFGNLPLHYAVWGRQPEAVKLLLEHGADPMKPCRYENRLHFRLNMRTELLSGHQDNYAFEAEGLETAPLFHAMNFSLDGIVADMIASADTLGGIDLLVRKGWDHYIPAMVEKGADPDKILAPPKRDSKVISLDEEFRQRPEKYLINYRRNALALAMESQDKALVKMLLDLGAHPRSDQSGDNFYAVAALNWGDMEILALLKEHGADFTKVNSTLIPVLYANGKDSIVEWLEKSTDIPRNEFLETREWGYLLSGLRLSDWPFDTRDLDKFRNILTRAPAGIYPSLTARSAMGASLESGDREIMSRVLQCRWPVFTLNKKERTDYIDAIRNSDLAVVNSSCETADMRSKIVRAAMLADPPNISEVVSLKDYDMSSTELVEMGMRLAAYGQKGQLTALFDAGLDPFAVVYVAPKMFQMVPKEVILRRNSRLALLNILNTAVAAHQADIVRLILARGGGAYFKAQPERLSSAIWMAIAQEDEEIFRLLAQQGAILDQAALAKEERGHVPKPILDKFRAIYEEYAKVSPAAPD